MKKKGIYQRLCELVQDILFGSDFAGRARKYAEDFIRNRDLPLPYLCTVILRNIKQSLQLELDHFYDTLGWRLKSVSKQAFSQARSGLNPHAIAYIFNKITREMCKVKDLEYYHDRYRLCAIDGSDIALYNSDELKETFGCSGGSAKAVSALVSLAYDPLNNIILDGSLNPVNTDERIYAKQHIEWVKKLPLRGRTKNLFIMDRGYPSRDFLAWLIKGKHKFLMRVRRKFNLDFDSVNRDETVSFVWENKTYRIRILKIILDSGETETLITNLDEADMPYENAAELYFKRWGIETKFNALKNKLELENMSGRRVITVAQDFWASLFLANMFASLEWETNAIIEERADNSNKYQQTTNENRLISKAREQFIMCLLETCPKKKKTLYSLLFEDIARRPVEIKPGRTSKRSTPRKAKFHDTYKSVM
jgi:hypothetical protein